MDLKEVLKQHTAWILGESSGKRADFKGANLIGANLGYTNLWCADLQGADLGHSNLRGANLHGANLEGANLRDADLHGANLSYANLQSANLQSANLEYSSMRGANLLDANLWGVAGNRKEVKSIFVTGQYPITYTSEYMQIGCEIHKIQDWWEFDDAKIVAMDGKRALRFWREWKDMIRAIIEKSPAVKC